MSAVVAWLRLDLRRRWRSLIVLALLVAVASGTVLAAVAGARRGDTALPRLLARSTPGTAMVLPNQPGFDWDEVRALPEVEVVATFMLGMEIPVEELPEFEGFGFPPDDDQLLRTVERPVILDGALPDPNRADVVLATPRFVKVHKLGVGDSITVHLFSEQQVGESTGLDEQAPQPQGPRVRLRIAAVGFTPWGADQPGGDGGLLVTHGFAVKYRKNFYNEQYSYTNALVRLRGGAAALPAFQADLARVSGRHDIDLWNQTESLARQQRSFAFQARCLLAFGLAALAAAIFLIGQSVARYTASTVTDLQVMRAVGMTPRQAVRAAAASPFLAALAGVSAGVVMAGVASRWFPIGSASLVEPSPGIALDWTVLGLGWVAIPLVVLGGSAAAAWLAFSAQRAAAPTRPSAVAAATARAGLPVPVVVGTRFALETGRGRGAVPVRPALLGAIAGVLGVLGAFTFSSGVSDAATNPARFGQTWQLMGFSGWNDQDFVPNDKVLAAVATDPDVTAVDDARVGVAEMGPNRASVTLFTYRTVGKPVRVVLTSGRLPMSDSEIALAPTAAREVNARVGSRLTMRGAVGPERAMTVVGIGFTPWSPHSDYDNGGWMTPAGFHVMFGDKFKFHLSLVSLRKGADPQTVQPRLGRLAAAVGGEAAQFAVPDPPTPVGELRQVRVLPIALGVFLVLLAIGAVGHALATAVRRRRHDVAVLRAVGMTRWQSRGVVVTQASVLAVVGLAFGVPLGIALGRTVWRVVADYTPLQYVPPVAFWALLAIGPAALLLANSLAAWPGRQAARLRIGHVLRAE